MTGTSRALKIIDRKIAIREKQIANDGKTPAGYVSVQTLSAKVAALRAVRDEIADPDTDI